MRSDRRLFFVLPVLLLLALVTPAAGQMPPSPDDARRAFLETINAERTRLGLKPLALNPALVQVFLPEVEDAGIGFGSHQGMPVYTFVVARSEASYLADYTVHLFERQTARFQDLDSLRRELIERINEVRTEKGLHPLSGDPTLDLAAQDYADDLFQGIKQGKNGPASGIPLTRRVVLRHYHPEGASGIGQAVVQGALSPEVTLAALLGNRIGGRSEVLGKGYQQIGIGLAFERKGDTFDVVWVQCLARPAPKS